MVTRLHATKYFGQFQELKCIAIFGLVFDKQFAKTSWIVKEDAMI